jgi:hypothetical protein
MENQHEAWNIIEANGVDVPSLCGPAMFDDTVAGKSIHDQYFCR